MKVPVCEDVMQELPGVTVPDIVGCCHPFWGFIGKMAVVSHGESLPGDVTNECRIDFGQEIGIGRENVDVIGASPVSDERGANNLRKGVYGTG